MGLMHGKQLRDRTVGFTKLIADQNLNMSGETGTHRIVNLSDGFQGNDAVNLNQLQSSISAVTTTLIGGDGLSGSGTTDGGTIQFDVNVDNQSIYILDDKLKLGNVNNEVAGDFVFAGDMHIGGSAIIDGDVTILGTATTINTDELLVKDNRIVVNSNVVSGGTTPRYSGLDIFRSSGYTDSSSLLWDETNKTWIIQSPWLNGDSGSGTTNNHSILTTNAIGDGNAIVFTLGNFGDGISNGLNANVLYDDVTIKRNNANQLYSIDNHLTATTLTAGELLFEGSNNFSPITLSDLHTTLDSSTTISANTSVIEVGGSIKLDINDNSIGESKVDFGLGTDQVDASVLPIDPIPGMTATTTQEALIELKVSSGLKAVPTVDDKNLTPSVLSSDGIITTSGGTLVLSEVPAEGGQVMLMINGVGYVIGSVISDDIYFTSDGGVSAVLPENVTTLTNIYMKTTNLFNLDTEDRIDLVYSVLR